MFLERNKGYPHSPPLRGSSIIDDYIYFQLPFLQRMKIYKIKNNIYFHRIIPYFERLITVLNPIACISNLIVLLFI